MIFSISSYFYFVEVHILFVVILGGNNFGSNSDGIRKWCVAAFRSSGSGGNSGGNKNSGRRNYQSDSFSPLTATSSSSDHDNNWILRLEEEFKKSGDNNNNNNSSNKNKKGEEEYTVSMRRSFQTPVTTYTDTSDLLNVIDNARSNDLTIVLFFSFYCRTCHRASIPFKKMAYEYSSTSTPTDGMSFVRFETSVLTPKQFRFLGLDRVPYIQIYRNQICVSSFKVISGSVRNAQMMLQPRLLENISVCRNRSVAGWSSFRDKYDKEIERNKAARQKLREEINNGNSHSNYPFKEDDNDTERRYRSVRTLTSEDELLQIIRRGDKKNDDDDRNSDVNEDVVDILVIMFHNHFEQSCLRAQHKYRKIANEKLMQQLKERSSPSHSSSWCMARIESSVVSDNTLQLLGVRSYPHFQVYSGQRTCLASFSIPQPYLFAKILRESLDNISTRTSQEWTEFYEQNKDEINSQNEALDIIIRHRQ